ncbi:MAG: hypothetical protein ACLFRT_12910 [Actinomycetota bacterium]
MRSSSMILVTAVAVVLLSSCGPPTIDEIGNRSFSSVSDFEDAVSCSDHFRVFPDWAGEVPVIETEDEAMEIAASLLDASQPPVEEAVKAGDVWLLVDGAGLAFAAMESVGASIGGCSRH